MSAISDARLTVTDLACHRGGRMLFADVTLELGPGEALLVAGANGAGKSSLLRVVAGLLRPSAGSVAILGRLALADEALALATDEPLADALGWWARLDGADADAVPAALEAMGIAHLAEIPARLLSTGQRKRATLARVIASGAPVWLLDEPLNGLDDAGVAAIEAAVAAHRAGGGIAVVASHQQVALGDAQMLRIGAT